MASVFARTSLRLAAVGLLGSAAATSVLAQAQGLLDNRFVVDIGAFILQTNVNGNLNGQSVQNPELDFNNDFGKANNASRGRLDALWRITPTQHVYFGYFNNSQTSSKAIDRDIHWGDYTFHAGGNVEAERSFKVYQLNYEYAFSRSPTHEYAASLGVHYTNLDLTLSGNATLTHPDGSTTAVGNTTKTGNVPAPLPVIGLRGAWVVAPQWVVGASGQLFKYNGNGAGGNWSDIRVNATWMFQKNFGAGLGYDRFYTHINVDKPEFNGNLKFGYSGLMLYLTGAF